MSVQRRYAQRNNNMTTLVPIFNTVIPNVINITNQSVYTLQIPNVQYVGGIYMVDLSGVDTNGNLLNIDGLFASYTNNQTINIISFIIDSSSAVHYPGLEFTIFFKNIPFDRFTANVPGLTVSIIDDINFAPIPYILSAPFPGDVSQHKGVSITLKSDGEIFHITSAGPAGWLGLPALATILSNF